MKNNIVQAIKILVFISIFLIVLLIITYSKKPMSVDLLNISSFYSEKKNSLDMVYIGGSACFVYWEPLKAWEDKGIASYDFAANTIQAELYVYLIKEVLKSQSPEVIVIDARAFQYRDFDQPPNEVAYRNVLTGTPFSIDRYKFIEENVSKYLKEDTLSYHFDIVKYHTVKENNSFDVTSKMILKKYINPLKGFYFVPKFEKLKKEDFLTDVEKPLSSDTDKILDDLLKYLKTTDQKVLFVVSPYIETKSQKESFNYVERKVIESGYQFLDTNEYYKEMGLDFSKDFYHFAHVNIFGAEKYTEFLEEYLKQNYNLIDRRNDDNYKEDWDNLLENWNVNVTNTKNIINNLIESGN